MIWCTRENYITQGEIDHIRMRADETQRSVAGGHAEGKVEVFEKLCTPVPYVTAMRRLMAFYSISARRNCLNI
jgi:hypothetical protein